MIKTRTIKVTERFCDLCTIKIDECDGLPDRCPDCGKHICPRCTGYYKATVSKFHGYSGTTKPLTKISKILCLECGIKFEGKLLELGMALKVMLEPERG